MAKSRAQKEKAAPEQSLTAIRLSGFKCFKAETEVKIRPLTLLAGANSGGKSSLIQPLLLLKQTLEAPFDPGPLLLDGPLVKVDMAATLFWHGKAKNDRATRWWVETEGSQQVRTTFVSGKSGLRLESTEDRRKGAVFRENMTPDEIETLKRNLFPDTRILQDIKIEPFRIRSQIAVNVQLRDDKHPIMFEAVSVFPTDFLLDLIHLPGLRGNPERSYRLTHAVERFPGPFQTYTAGLLQNWKGGKDDLLTRIGEDLRTLGLSWKVDLRQRSDTEVEVHLGRLHGPQQGGAMDTVNIADVGFGASQILPVVVALQVAKPGQVVHIEQPELHLHPKAQRQLADLLIAAAKRGVIVIAETHSSVLLTAVQLRVADSTIRPDQVALHWFTRDEDGAAHVQTAEIDAQGAYGDWPVDFADVEMAVERDYINAAFGPKKA